jgi:hypothetical protein
VEDAAVERARAKFEAQCSKRAATKLKKTTDRAKETVAKRLAVTQKRKAKKLAKAARLSAAILGSYENAPGLWRKHDFLDTRLGTCCSAGRKRQGESV